jgi:hypothetical protein
LRAPQRGNAVLTQRRNGIMLLVNSTLLQLRLTI